MLREANGVTGYDRRVFCRLLFASAASTLLPSASAQRHHRPPWRLPVASSHILHIGGAALQIDFGPGELDLPRDAVLTTWVEHAARAVTVYYGRFPVRRYRLLIVPVPGRSGVFGGTTWGGVGGFPAFTRIHVGQHTTRPALDYDWMMTHEMIHTAFPSQPDEHHWIEEGLATYVEPVARVQAGFLQPERIWSDMVRDMPKGSPPPFGRGLDRTHTWGRTYWGGAQFCLLADVDIRKRTSNHKGLQDALRAIVYAGGTIDQEWPLKRALSVGDEATGTGVLMNEYTRMADAPVPVNLDKIWKELGIVRLPDGGVRFDDAARFAAIRRGITQAAKSPDI